MSVPAHENDGIGAYGLAVLGIPGASEYAAPVASDASSLRVHREIGTDPQATSRLYEDRAVIPLLDDGVLFVDRAPAEARYRHPRPISDGEMLHPWLVPAAATVSAWLGRRVLHGGLVSNGESCVAVVGDKEGGKSTLLAHIALSTQLSVMADDLIVLDGEVAFAGPRLIDLRPGSLPHLPGLDGRTLVRDNTRIRMRLPAAPATSQLVGIVVLQWGDATGLEYLSPGKRLPELLPHALTEGIPPGVTGVLAFASYPTWRLIRPRRWDALASSADAIQSLLR